MLEIKTGLELEFEFADHFFDIGELDYYLRKTAWCWERDGSLKENGIELKLRNPLLNKKLEGSLFELPKILSHINVPLKNYNKIVSDRTGLHIHLNLRNIQDNSILNILLSFILFEKLFFLLTSEVRNFSPFNQKVLGTLLHKKAIIGAQKTENYIREKYSSEEYMPELQLLAHGWPKYSSFNFKPYGRFGSLEIRMIPCFPHPIHVRNWISLCHSVFLFGQNNQLTNHNVLFKLFKDAKDYDKMIAMLSINDIQCRKFLKDGIGKEDLRETIQCGVQTTIEQLEVVTESNAAKVAPRPKMKKAFGNDPRIHIREVERILEEDDGQIPEPPEPREQHDIMGHQMQRIAENLSRRYGQHTRYNRELDCFYTVSVNGRKTYYKARYDGVNARYYRERIAKPNRRRG